LIYTICICLQGFNGEKKMLPVRAGSPQST
jgi:hypothetical protein